MNSKHTCGECACFRKCFPRTICICHGYFIEEEEEACIDFCDINE